MRILDITCLQSCSQEETSRIQVELLAALDQFKNGSWQIRCLILQYSEGLLSLREKLAHDTENNPLLHLDLADMDEPHSSALLTRFMVTQGITDWYVLPNRSSLIPQSTLCNAAAQAGVLLHNGYSHNQPSIISLNTFEPQLSKPTLTLVAPYPPVKSGIADYVERQVAYLQHYYQLVLVDEKINELDEAHPFPGSRVTPQTFLETPALHRRVLYHLGNSPAHLTAFNLLTQVSGLVVLHDFFLSDVQQYEDIILHGKNHASFNELIHAHGYRPLLEAFEAGQSINLSNYPCNLGVLDKARKVLVHSNYIMEQAVGWYGGRIKQRIRRIDFARASSSSASRKEARSTLGYSQTAYLVGTFGFATPAKCLETLINAWATSIFAQSRDSFLLIAGEFLDERYLGRIERLIALRQCANVKLLGYLPPEDYAHYLSIVDVAVQLRTRSRGETSAALLDCLASGVPVVANNHGFVEDLPDHVVWKINPLPDVSELTAVLEQLYQEPYSRQVLSANALAYLAKAFNPLHVVEQLVCEVENSAATGICQTTQGIVQQLDQLNTINSESQRVKLARALEYNQPQGYNRQLLIDVTAVARFDLRTGIQRVVRALLRELVMNPPEGYQALPTYLDADGCYHYAHSFMLQTLGLPQECLNDEVVRVHDGDVFFGVDLHTTTMVRHAAIYDEWRLRGVRIVNVLYDLLPVRSPQWFPAMVYPDFNAWLRHVALKSDGVLAISRTVAEDFEQWLQEQRIDQQRPDGLKIGWFHLGSDLHASVPSKGLPDNAQTILNQISSAPSFLMVATVEPRKGHAQTLDAFEALWAQGYQYNLVIVGKEGWKVESLASRIRQHPKLGAQLHWLEGISDEYLEQIYPRCAALLAASEGEGFGLPLIEAARHHIPVIARDIPVFREVGGEGVYYFSAASAEQFAQEISKWANLPASMRPDVEKIRCLTWQESSRQVVDFLNTFHCDPKNWSA